MFQMPKFLEFLMIQAFELISQRNLLAKSDFAVLGFRRCLVLSSLKLLSRLQKLVPNSRMSTGMHFDDLKVFFINLVISDNIRFS